MKNKLNVFLTLSLISNMAFAQNNQIGGNWVERQSDNQRAIIAVNKLDRQYTWVVSSYPLDKAQQEMQIFYKNNQNQNQTLHTGEGAGSIFESNGNILATVQHQNPNLELGGDWKIVDFDKKPFAQMNFDIGESFNRERTLFKFKNPVLFIIETKDIANCNKFTLLLT